MLKLAEKTQTSAWKRRQRFAVAAALLTSFLNTGVQAAEFSETWTSVRALGMGNAYTSIVEDSDALFYNPAGLARISGFNWTVFDLRAGLNGTEAVQNAQAIANAQDNLAETIRDLYGKRIWVGSGAKSAIIIPNFGIAGFYSTEAGVNVRNPAYPTMNLNYFFDYGVKLGVAFDLIPSIFKVGLAAKRVNRTGTTLPLGPSVLATLETSALEAELKRRGTGYGFDLGVLLTVPGPVSPSISFVYKDMGGTSFTHEEGAGAPPRIEPEMIIGGSLQVSVPLISITPSFDYKYADRQEVQLGKKLHLGLEISLPLIDIRGGLHQGYYTAGLGLDLGIIRADVATYGVELGEYPGQQEDRRYIAQLTFELGFDPGKFGFGSFSGKSGERRRLKQRR